MRLMTIFKMFGLLALTSVSVSSYSVNVTLWDALVSEHKKALDSKGYFVDSDKSHYYVGLRSAQADSLETEFEFLLQFEERISSVLNGLCIDLGSTLPASYQFSLPFSKNIAEDEDGTLFIASLEKQLLKEEARLVCARQ